MEAGIVRPWRTIAICTAIAFCCFTVAFSQVRIPTARASGSGDWPPPAPPAIWVIDNATSIENETIIVQGNIVANQSNLFLKNVTFIFNSTPSNVLVFNCLNNFTSIINCTFTVLQPDTLFRLSISCPAVMENSTLKNIYRCGIYYPGVIIKNNTLQDGNTGFFFGDSADSSMLVGNRIFNCSDKAVFAYGDYLSIVGNRIESNGVGISMDASYDTHIINNTFHNNEIGIQGLRYSPYSSSSCTIDGNFIYNSTINAISLLNTPGSLVNNTIIGCFGNGVIIDNGFSTYYTSTMNNNSITGCGSNGVFVNKTYVYLYNNTIHACTGSGIHMLFSGTFMADNKIRKCGLDGICLILMNRVIIRNSVFEDNGRYGVFIDDSGTYTSGQWWDARESDMYGNRISRNGAGGIAINRVHWSTFINNVIEHNGGPGMILQTPHNCTVCSNQFSGNDGPGLYIFDGDEVMVCHNVFTWNDGPGIQLSRNCEEISMISNVFEHNTGPALFHEGMATYEYVAQVGIVIFLAMAILSLVAFRAVRKRLKVVIPAMNPVNEPAYRKAWALHAFAKAEWTWLISGVFVILGQLLYVFLFKRPYIEWYYLFATLYSGIVVLVLAFKYKKQVANVYSEEKIEDVLQFFKNVNAQNQSSRVALELAAKEARHGYHGRAMAFASDAFTFLKTTDDVVARLHCMFYMVGGLIVSEQFTDAERMLDDALALARDAGDPDILGSLAGLSERLAHLQASRLASMKEYTGLKEIAAQSLPEETFAGTHLAAAEARALKAFQAVVKGDIHFKGEQKETGWNEFNGFTKDGVHVTGLKLTLDQADLLPDAIGIFTRLEMLRITGGSIVVLPESILACNGLKLLVVTNSKLIRLPDGIHFLQSLEKIDVSNNQLLTIPDKIYSLPALKDLDISNNFTSGFTLEVGKTTSLETLTALSNRIEVLPEAISQLSRLERLNVASNRLVNLPDSMAALKRLKVLDVSYNKFGLFSSDKALVLEILKRRNKCEIENKKKSSNGMEVWMAILPVILYLIYTFSQLGSNLG